MDADELDRALSEDDDIVPSSGFVINVMDAVSREITAPPIPFPWSRAWPLAAALVGALAWLIVTRLTPAAPVSEDPSALFASVHDGTTGRLLLALLLATVSTVVPIRISRLD